MATASARPECHAAKRFLILVCAGLRSNHEPFGGFAWIEESI
jgi:hypothetical protein